MKNETQNSGLTWYDCDRCDTRYSDIIHDDCPECGNPDTVPTLSRLACQNGTEPPAGGLGHRHADGVAIWHDKDGVRHWLDGGATYAADRTGDVMRRVTLADQQAGDLIKRKPDARTVYVVNFRERKKPGKPAVFSLSPFDDMNREIFLKETTPVYVGFTF